MANDNELTIKINGNAKDFLTELDKIKQKTKDIDTVLSTTAKTAAVAFVGFTTAIVVTTKAFADYETALVGVGKTTNVTGDELKKFGKEFQKLAQSIPVSTNELLGIAQAAGQLGVKGEENLIKFTDTVAKLGVATDLSGTEAATALARILNVTRENISSIGTLGSVIVAMGNNFAASESEIVRVTTEVARATSVFRISSADAVALATSMRSMGIQAELGGSAVGRTFRTLDAVIKGGGSRLENLAKVTGLTGEQLKKTFQTDSIEVFKSFVEGLGKMEEKVKGSSTQALAAFGLKGDEINKVLPVLAINSEKMGEAFALSAKEVKNATALNNEARNAFNTLNSDVQILKNTFETFKVAIGEKLAPEIRGLIGSAGTLLKSFSSLDSNTVSVLASFIKWGAIISGLVTGTTAFLFGIIKLSSVIGLISATFLPATFAASAFWVAVTGPIGLAIAGFSALAIGVAGLYKTINQPKAPETLDEVTNALDRLKKKKEDLNKVDFGREFNTDRLGKNIRALDEEINKLEELRQAKIKSSSDFGTGEFLVKPKAQGALSDLIPSFGNATIPLAPAGDNKAAEEAKKSSAEVEGILDAATVNRIAAAQREQATLLQIKNETAEGLLAEDLAYINTKAGIDEQIAAANLIKDEQERALALENIQLKNEQELAKIAEIEAKKAELVLQRREEQNALRDVFEEEDRVRLETFTNTELQEFQRGIDTKAEAQKKFDTERINKAIATNNQFLQDELRYGTQVATMKKFFNSEEVQGVKDTSGQLVALTNSKNSALKGIGKAAASTNAAIATAEGAIKAYTSLAGIPIVGPALGVAAAAALTVYGVEQQARILGANSGGIVPSSLGSIAGVDSVPAMLTPNELVVPAKSFEEVINATAAARINEGNEQSSSMPNVIIQGDFYGEETFIDKIAEKLYDAQKNRNVILSP